MERPTLQSLEMPLEVTFLPGVLGLDSNMGLGPEKKVFVVHQDVGARRLRPDLPALAAQ